MEDKRKIANEELSPVLDSGLVQIDTPQPSNFVDLQPEPASVAEQTGTVLNNFNVNVNVTEPTNYVERQLTTTINKALPTVSQVPSEIKKNSPPLSVEQSETDAGIANKAIQTENETPNINTILNEFYTEPTQIPLSVDLMQLQNDMESDVSVYDYTSSPLMNKDSKFKSESEELRQSIQNTLSVNNETIVSPPLSVDVSNYSDNSYSSFETMENIQLNQTANPIDIVNDLANKRERQRIELQETAERSAQQKTINDNVADDGFDNYQSEMNLSRMNEGAGPENRKFLQTSRTFNHINPSSNTIELTESKMNRPPVWRSVLG